MPCLAVPRRATPCLACLAVPRLDLPRLEDVIAFQPVQQVVTRQAQHEVVGAAIMTVAILVLLAERAGLIAR